MADTKFWANTNALLKENGLTQEAMCSTLGIPLNTVRGWVSKDVLPRVDEGVKIAKYLGTTVEYLLSGSAPDASYYKIPRDLLEAMRKYV